MFKHGKKSIFSFFVWFCFTQQGFAAINGHPDEDPVVKALRDEFAGSVAPSAEEVVGKWECHWFFAYEGDFRDSVTEFEMVYVKNNVFQNRNEFVARLRNDGLRYSYQGLQIYNLRINRPTGEFIVEASAFDKLGRGPDSITQTGFKGFAYGRCSHQVSQ